MMNFIQQNLISILIIAAIIIVVVVLFYSGKKKQAKLIVHFLVQEAEIRFGSGTGKMKYKYVISLVYPRLPAIVKLFISEEQISLWIDEGVQQIKKATE